MFSILIKILMFFKLLNCNNKRAQRALGPSTEEKVKGYIGAIYSGPLGLVD